MKIQGIVLEVRKEEGKPHPHSFIIQGEDNKKYIAHLRDLEANENLLYKHQEDHETASLQEGQKVDFDIFSKQEKAIHVRPIN